MPTKQRLEFLDACSGLMLVHMIIGHVLQHGGLYRQGIPYDYVLTALFFFMPWFYFKAGLFIGKKGDLKSWLIKDCRRLIVPFVVFTILGALIAIPFEMVEDAGRPWWKIMLGPVTSTLRLGSYGGNFALWFLLSLFFTRLTYRLVPERSCPLALAVAVAGGAACGHFGIRLPLALSTVFPGMAFLLLGRYSKPYITGEGLTKLNGGVIILAYIALVWLFNPRCNLHFNELGSHYLLTILIAWVGCLAAAALFRRLPMIRPLAHIGSHSMTYYVWHWLPIYLANHTLRHLCPDLNPHTKTIYILVFTAIVLALLAWKGHKLPDLLRK